jgi:L,D-transpeptidase YcbB
MFLVPIRANAFRYVTSFAVVVTVALGGQSVLAQTTAFTQAVATASAQDDGIAQYYKARDFQPLWTGADDAARRAALFSALADASAHGLPVQRYDAAGLKAAFQSAVTEGDRGRLEVRMTQAFLDYANDVGTGVLTPTKVDPGILRSVARRDPVALLAQMETGSPKQVLRALPPKAPEYARLMKEKLTIEALIARGGYGPVVTSTKLQAGDVGPQVVALRDRLAALGYLGRSSATQTYDAKIEAAVQRFQADHGLAADGTAGEGTIAELNVTPEQRLKSIVVAMERLRWLGDVSRDARYIWVNQPDFSAQIIDHGKVTFQTRAVIGRNSTDTRSPEFSDEMEYMVINPSWGVPRSIIVKEYLPLLQKNPNAVQQLDVIDRSGRIIPREQIDFASYSASSFPFGLRQPPSDGNALGKVKFMFPNKNNIYLHDTPSKDLFGKEVRAFSHGCIRLADPFDFAYTLLAPQTSDPKGEFARHLATRNENTIGLDHHVPVHLVYFTAWPTTKGQMTYRRDVYGRDGRIFDALAAAGVVLPGVQG